MEYANEISPDAIIHIYIIYMYIHIYMFIYIYTHIKLEKDWFCHSTLMRGGTDSQTNRYIRCRHTDA
jgi:hypothetical protein